MAGFITFIIFLIIALMVLASCIKIVPQASALILERLGAYRGTWGVGIHFKVPFIERVAKRVNLKEQVVDWLFKHIEGFDRSVAEYINYVNNPNRL